MAKNKVNKLTLLTMLAAMAIAINLFESIYIVPFIPMFGIRFGLANIIALITMELFGTKEMIQVNILRVLIGNLLRGTIFGTTFWISAAGVALSSLVIILCKKVLKLPVVSTSLLSAIAHSSGQVLLVSFIYNQTSMLFIIPTLLLTSIPTGILTGLIASNAYPRLKRFKV